MKLTKKFPLRLQAIILSLTLLLTFMIPNQIIFALDGDQTANTDIARTLDLSYKLKDAAGFITLNEGDKISDSSKIEQFHAKYTFALEDNVNESTGEPERTMISGDYYLINLPNTIQITNPVDGVIKDSSNFTIATYTFIHNADSTWQIKVIFTSYIDDTLKFDIYGQMEFDFGLDLSSVGAGSTTTIYIPITNTNGVSIDVTKPVPLPTTPVSLLKTVSSYNDQTRQLEWNVEITPNAGVFSGCIFKDTIDTSKLDLISIKHGTVTLIENTDYTYNSTTGEIVYTIPSGRDGTSYKNITITSEVKRSVYGNLTPTVITNQANLSGGASYIDITSNTATRTITPVWLKKEGTLFEGNKILWTLTANTTRQNMYNAVITDNFQSDVSLDTTSVKLGAATITVHDIADGYVPANDTEVYGVYKINGDSTSELKIYLTRDKVNASNATQTITFETDIVKPADNSVASPVYNNTASMEANYVTDGDGEGAVPTINLGQVGVAVPLISVTKGYNAISADDKANGTITWTISAASNLSSYGKSQIIDTLPTDQDFVADGIYMGAQKLDDTTEPKAEISGDGRILTITFNNNNGLVTQKNFTVKTKIKQAVYGTNLSNRSFTNSITGKLLEDTTETVLATSSSSNSVSIKNTIIAKSSVVYNENTTKMGENPRVNFSIAINNNLMPLSGVTVTDDLSKIITQFKKSGETAFSTVDGVKWTYVPGTLKIVKSAGTSDSLDLAAITSSSTYLGDIINVNFGTVRDKYTVTFTAELDVAQNDIFKENGTIRCNGNIADIAGIELNNGKISTAATGNSAEIKNEVLGKSGVNLVDSQQILWSINLNQHRIALNNSKVVDILPLGITLDPTSIKLYKNVIATNGNFVTGNTVTSQGTDVPFTYTYLPSTEPENVGRFTLTVDLPDNKTDYVLRFTTDVADSLLGKEVNNSAYYTGVSASTENTNSSTLTISGSAGGGSTTKSSITINKKSSDTGSSVNGASFELNWLRGGNPLDPVLVRTLTATTGSVTFYGLTLGEKYSITEVSAPAGYLIDSSDPVEFTVPSSSGIAIPDINFYDTPTKEGSWSPEAIKHLDGKNFLHDFNFLIKSGQDNIMTGITKDNLPNGDKTVEFTMESGVSRTNNLEFSDSHKFADTDVTGTEHLVTSKTFEMSEINSILPGYSFDNKVYSLDIKVYNVKGENNLKIVIEDENGNVLSDNNGIFKTDKIPIFNNLYTSSGGIQFIAEKTLNGQYLSTNQFSFDLYEGANLIETVKNKAGTSILGNSYKGNIDFSPINYTLSDVGTKTYTIKEKNTNLAGYTYDNAEYSIVVNISDNNDDGVLTITKSIQKMVDAITTSESTIGFSNTYIASGDSVNLTATKVLKGGTLKNDQFSFVLNKVDSNGNKISEVSTVKNIDNSITFPSLSFSQGDVGSTYYYQVSEVNTREAGYTYDKSVYNVKIDVLDNKNGTISALKTITKSNIPVTEIIFTNSRYDSSGGTQPPTTEPPKTTEPPIKHPPIITNPDTPKYKPADVPDPNDPNSPTIIIVITDDAIPRIPYIKTEKPDGTFEYIDDEGVPLASLPNTGDNMPISLYIVIIMVSLYTSITILKKKINLVE